MCSCSARIIAISCGSCFAKESVEVVCRFHFAENHYTDFLFSEGNNGLVRGAERSDQLLFLCTRPGQVTRREE